MNESFFPTLCGDVFRKKKEGSLFPDGGQAPKQFVINDKTTYAQCPPATGQVATQLQEVTQLWKTFEATLDGMLSGRQNTDAKDINDALAQNMTLLKEMNAAVGTSGRASLEKVN